MADVALLANRHVVRGPYPDGLRACLDPEEAARARSEIVTWPGYAPTPLHDLRALAARLGVAAVRYKDEAGRFGLGSFKALGGAYAVYRLLRARVGAERDGAAPSAADLVAGEHRDVVSRVTVCCATDGNHGRSVAWGARLFGCDSVIYLHEHVSGGREEAIARHGARIVRTAGGYDESVRRAAHDAAAKGWTVVSDTSWDGYTEIPRDVMHGYVLMVDEALEQLRADAPTHVFVQGGVGGVAAAVCARLWWEWGAQRPVLVVVEPERAACLHASARAGSPEAVTIAEETVMACLSAGEPSLIAWDVLAAGAEFFATVPEEAAPEAMRMLAAGRDGDPPIVAGESGAAGLAGLVEASRDRSSAETLGLGPGARILLFGTEGATDPRIYARLVGRPPEEVAPPAPGGGT